MAPPYKLIDEATGEVATGPDGERWENMDVAPGNTMELFDTTDDSKPWPRVSPSELVRPGTGPGPQPPDPGPDPIPPTPGDDGMDSVTNETQLRDALQTYANEARVGSLGSKTPILLTQPIVIQQRSSDGFPWGVNANFLRVLWRGDGGRDMITYQGVDGIGNRCLYIEKICMDGNGYGAAPAGSCLKLYAPDGDPGSIYKFTIRDFYSGYATHGVTLAGAVFEGLMENIHAENHTGDGIYMEHLGLDGSAPWSIVSNIMIVHPNSSRNFGAGMRQVYSVNSIMGSYVLNAEGGIVGPDGIRSVLASNGENTGEQLFVLGSNGYGSVVEGCEASSDGASHARRWDGSGWVSVGKPLLYGMNDVGAHEEASHMAYYGNPPNNTRWMK
jgi:hypothetical protein